ncbi:MAG: SDR family NAD(P)-dependent oxidoreductase [Bacteroidaceae bacterium]|nr:SDR family NAD(P)-dependent oxidoreductase [Bacteroidaceae bacterium]
MVITGGSRGIGAAAVREFCRRGDHVSFLYASSHEKAKALAQETPVILLDEPTAFLDYKSRVQLFQELKRLAVEEQKAIILSTHDLELTLQIADKIWLINDKRLHTGSISKLSDNGILSKFIDDEGIHYNKTTRRIEIL